MGNYELLLVPILSSVIGQLAKFLFPGNKLKLDFSSLSSYSGMPSSHSAMMASLVTTAALMYGISSPIFAVSAILAIITIRDAVGLRQKIGEQAKLLNKLAKTAGNNYPVVSERVGHSVGQVAVGVLLGIVISVVVYYIWVLPRKYFCIIL